MSDISASHLSALILKEFGVYLLADDLGANVILDSNAEPHLFQDEFGFLLFFHGAVRFNLTREAKEEGFLHRNTHLKTSFIKKKTTPVKSISHQYNKFRNTFVQTER